MRCAVWLFGGGKLGMQFAREVVLRKEIWAIQLFGHILLERIPPGSVIVVDRPSTYTRMIEVVWQEKRYIVFQRDLEERTETVKHRWKNEPAQIKRHTA